MGLTWVLSAPDGPHVGPMNLAIRNPVSFSEMQVLFPIQKIQKGFSYIKLQCFKFWMHPRLHLLLICLFSHCLSMICLFVINSLFTYSLIYCLFIYTTTRRVLAIGSHTHVKSRCRELPVYIGNRFGGHVFCELSWCYRSIATSKQTTSLYCVWKHNCDSLLRYILQTERITSIQNIVSFFSIIYPFRRHVFIYCVAVTLRLNTVVT